MDDWRQDARQNRTMNAMRCYVVAVTELETLLLSGSSQVSDEGLRHLSELSNLTILRLGGTRVGDGLRYLSELSNLEVLDLGSTQVRNEHIRHLSGLTGLQELDLGGTLVTDKCLKDLAGLSGRLLKLDINTTAISKEGIAFIKRALPKCNIRSY